MLTSLLAALDNVYAIAAVWIGLAFLASTISVRLGLSVALVEILVGVAAGNLHGRGRRVQTGEGPLLRRGRRACRPGGRAARRRHRAGGPDRPRRRRPREVRRGGRRGSRRAGVQGPPRIAQFVIGTTAQKVNA